MILWAMACRCGYRENLLKKRDAYQAKTATYLDYNATTPVDPAVIGAFERSCRNHWANPASLHSAGISAWREMNRCLEALSTYFTWPREGMRFCSSGSEGLDTLISTLLEETPDITLITSSVEHSSLHRPLRIRQMRCGGQHDPHQPEAMIVGVDGRGKIRQDELEAVLKTRRRCVFLYSPVNHETGAVQDAESLYRLVKNYGGMVYLDAVQAAARRTPSFWTGTCDGFVISSHKLYAPKGLGVLFFKPRKGTQVPDLSGGRTAGAGEGTPSTPLIAALAEAVRRLDPDGDGVALKALTGDFLHLMDKAGLKYQVFTPPDSVPGVLCFRVEGITDMEDFFSHLYARDICLSRFSACTARVDGVSRILHNMGFADQEACASLRLSLGRYSRRKDLIEFITAAGDYLRRR